MLLLMVLLYPIVSHSAITLGHPRWSAAYLLVLIGLFLGKELIGGRYWVVLMLSLLFAAGSWLVWREQSAHFMYLPPVVISAGLLLVFGRTLQEGKTPLITRYAQLIDGEISAEIAAYTFRITQVWTAFFLLLLIESILLAAFAPTAIWSLFTNVINYVAIALLFFADYLYRRRVYRDLPRRSFVQFMRQVVRIKPSELGV